jgi:uncharacterized protein (TIGR03083 family)
MEEADPALQAYDQVRQRVLATVRSPDVDLESMPVPACPAWNAKALVGHLVGIAEDWVNGRLDGYGSDRWTWSQVEATAARSISELADAWDGAFEILRQEASTGRTGGPAGSAPLGAGTMLFGDAVVHEADLYPAVTPGGRVPDEAVAPSLKAGIAMWRSALGAAGAPPLVIAVPGWREWAVGEVDGATTRVEAPAYELWRALYGRRSRAQVAAFAWSGDSCPYLDAGLPFPFSWAGVPLTD